MYELVNNTLKNKRKELVHISNNCYFHWQSLSLLSLDTIYQCCSNWWVNECYQWLIDFCTTRLRD